MIKNKILIAFIVFLACVACHKKPVEVPEERISLGDFIIQNTVELCCISRDTIPANSSIKLSDYTHTLTTPDYDCRIIYVDPCDIASGRNTHEGYYIFYNIANGDWKYVKSLGFIPMGYVGQPDDLGFNIAIPSDFLEAAKYNYQKIKQPAKPFINCATNVNSTITDNNTYVVILNSGYNISNNCNDFNEQCRSVFNLAKYHYAVNPNHLYVLMADGTSANSDYYDSESLSFKNTDPDLDGDGISDIQFAATRLNLSSVFSAIRSQVATGDNVLVYITGPSEKLTSNEVRLLLWGGDSLVASELKAFTQNIESKARVHYLIQSNYGGYFASTQPVIKSNGTITTACGASATNTTDSFNFTDDWCSDQTNHTHSIYSSSKANSGNSPQYYSNPQYLGIRYSPNGTNFPLPTLSGASNVQNGSISSYSISNLQDGMNVIWSAGEKLTLQPMTPNNYRVLASTTSPYYLNSYVKAVISGYTTLSTPGNIWRTGDVVSSDYFTISGNREFGTVTIKDEFQYDTSFEWTLDAGFEINLQAQFFIDYEASDDAGDEMTVSVHLDTPLGESLRIFQNFTF